MKWVFQCEPDDNDTLLITCNAFPEITTFANTIDDVYMPSLGALEEAIAARLADGREIPPVASKAEADAESLGLNHAEGGRYWMKLPSLLVSKIQLRDLMQQCGVSRAELARKLDWNRESVDRLLRPEHRTRHEQFDQAFDKLEADVDMIVSRRS